MKIILWLKNQIAPRQIDEDKRRSELILNILLIFSISGLFILNIIRLIDYLLYPKIQGLSIVATMTAFVFFIFLLWLSHKKLIKTASSLLIILFALPMIYSLFTWGVDLPAALLLAVLVIILSSILLGARFAFISTLIIGALLVVISKSQEDGLIAVKNYWRESPTQIGDVITNIILLIIISSVAWLFTREIKKSLKRAHLSEQLLKEERDLLEIKVETRTQELLALEAEKIKQLYRLAEFGRLSSGIFHDLINPLSAVSLNLEQIKIETDSKIISAKSYLNQALLATNKMAGLIASIKKQIARESSIQVFSLSQEIEQTIQILSYKAKRAQVEIEFLKQTDITLNGDALKFSQVITNILANAIEACEESLVKKVIINLTNDNNKIQINIKDTGAGIDPGNLQKIFLPFFSTKKSNGRGLGIGLATTKDIIEKDFSGEILVTSASGEGSNFLISIPKQNA